MHYGAPDPGLIGRQGTTMRWTQDGNEKNLWIVPSLSTQHPTYNPGASITICGTKAYRDRSFCCSGKRRVARQAKDHPEGLPTAWHTTWRSPFREKSGPGGQAHLHTTLNKSRDEKLDLAGPGCGNGSGKRPGVIGARARLPDGRCAQCLSAGKKRRLHLGSNQGPIG